MHHIYFPYYSVLFRISLSKNPDIELTLNAAKLLNWLKQKIGVRTYSLMYVNHMRLCNHTMYTYLN